MRVVTGISVLVLGAGGIGHAVVTSLETGIDRIDPFKDMKNRPRAGYGTNLLLVGTDGRDRITREESAANGGRGAAWARGEPPRCKGDRSHSRPIRSAVREATRWRAPVSPIRGNVAAE